MEDPQTYRAINATVAAIIVNKSDPKKILLTKRAIDPFMGKWCLPGGHIDAMETAQEAISREAMEETDIRINPVFFRYFDEIIPEMYIHNVVLVFIGMDDSGVELAENYHNNEVAEMKWFDIKHAAQLDLAFGHNKIVQEYFKAYHL
jgi:8-oxo-dGTP diphosphatase